MHGLQGRAVKAGMMVARGQQLLMADADGATKISDLAKLEDALKQLNTPGDGFAHTLASETAARPQMETPPPPPQPPVQPQSPSQSS